jgi:hypothetical protein
MLLLHRWLPLLIKWSKWTSLHLHMFRYFPHLTNPPCNEPQEFMSSNITPLIMCRQDLQPVRHQRIRTLRLKFVPGSLALTFGLIMIYKWFKGNAHHCIHILTLHDSTWPLIIPVKLTIGWLLSIQTVEGSQYHF